MTTTFSICVTANTIADGDQVWFEQLCAGMKKVVEDAGFIASIVEKEVEPTEYDDRRTAIYVQDEQEEKDWEGTVVNALWIRQDGSNAEYSYMDKNYLVAAITDAMFADKVED